MSLPAILADIALFPERASSTATYVDTLFFFLVSITGAAGLFVAFLLIYFSVRYRRRPGQTGPPPPTNPSRALEWFWTLTPLGIFMVIYVWGATLYIGTFRAPDDSTVIYGIGKQWMWKFQHPEGQREVDELHVPVGKPFKVLLTSEDVIHSFYVPDFRVHEDVLPDRFTSVWFKPIRPGRYHLFCSQYCGTNHAGMVGWVYVLEPRDYEAWLHGQPDPRGIQAEGSLALQGRKVFLKYRCVSCHSADENARAPVLEELYGKAVHLRSGETVVADDDYIRQSIYDPSARIVAGYDNIMPTFKGQVTAEELVELIAFVRGLGRGKTPRRVEEYPPPAGTPPIEPLTQK